MEATNHDICLFFSFIAVLIWLKTNQPTILSLSLSLSLSLVYGNKNTLKLMVKVITRTWKQVEIETHVFFLYRFPLSSAKFVSRSDNIIL
jgi:hypothetical protein